MRFTGKFTFEFKVSPDIEPENIEVLSMLLQPYIENSIWHGLLPLDSPGKVLINIEKRNDNLVFCVEDNGIGINTSREVKSTTDKNLHVSKGIEITRDRISLLKKMTNKDVHVVGPYEMKDDSNKTLGTKVEILLPEH